VTTQAEIKSLQCLSCSRFDARFLFPATSAVIFSGTTMETMLWSTFTSKLYILLLISWKLREKGAQGSVMAHCQQKMSKLVMKIKDYHKKKKILPQQMTSRYWYGWRIEVKHWLNKLYEDWYLVFCGSCIGSCSQLHIRPFSICNSIIIYEKKIIKLLWQDCQYISTIIFSHLI